MIGKIKKKRLGCPKFVEELACLLLDKILDFP